MLSPLLFRSRAAVCRQNNCTQIQCGARESSREIILEFTILTLGLLLLLLGLEAKLLGGRSLISLLIYGG